MNFLITFAAQYLPFLIGFVVLVSLIQERSRSLVARVVLAALLALATSELIKQFFYTPRPFVVRDLTPLISQPSDGSFPSSHVALLTAVIFSIFSKFRSLSWILLVMAGVVGWGRVAAGVHYPIDIAGGLAVGLVAALLAHYLKLGRR